MNYSPTRSKAWFPGGASLSDETEDFTGRTTVEETIARIMPEFLPEIIALEASVANSGRDDASKRKRPLL